LKVTGTKFAVQWPGWPLPSKVAVFPEVGVELSALDQILALLVGVFALLFSRYKAFRSRVLKRLSWTGGSVGRD